MADLTMLQEKITESGMTMTNVSRRSGVRRETLYNRLNGIGEFTASEIVGLTSALKLTKAERDKIFFTVKVESNDT